MDRALAAAAYMTTPKVRPTPNYPLELHYIRALFIQQNYRQCIHACRDVLRVAKDDFGNRPLQKTFVLFYLALAHDELARVMHPNSQTKLPAFNSAEHYFLEAVRALPSIEQARVHYAQSFQREADVLSDSGKPDTTIAAPESLPDFKPWDGNADAKSYQRLSSVRSASRHSLTAESDGSDDISTPSDFDELEAHTSFHEILASGNDRHLQRDFSCISLLDAPPVPYSRPQSHGLMRPIRLGSPPKPYHPPQFHRLTLDTNVRPPRRVYTDPGTFRAPSALSTAAGATPEKPSPVSPLNPADDRHSDTSTISPVSPTTPPHASPLPSPLPVPSHCQPSQPQPQPLPIPVAHVDVFADRLDAHLCAIRIQLETHIAMVQQAKHHLFRARADRLSSARTPPRNSLLTAAAGEATGVTHPNADVTATTTTANTVLSSGMSSPTAPRSPAQHEEDARRAEKKQRLDEGRERKWVRVRFAAERYRDLAERALAEL